MCIVVEDRLTNRFARTIDIWKINLFQLTEETMNRNQMTISLALIAIVASLAIADKPFVTMPFDKALEQAAKDKKLVFIDFYTTWCGPCKILEATTFSDAQVIEWLGKNTIALKVDAERELKLAEKYRIDSYPTLVFVNCDGKEAGRIVGSIGTKEFLDESNAILAGKDPMTRATERLEAAGKNDPLARMKFASSLAQMGKYDRALENYLWCFDEGVKHNPAFVGVRLSFLASELAQLATVHPPTLKALQQRRDAVLEEILTAKPKKRSLLSSILGGGDDRPPVGDLIVLNQLLGETSETIKLYDHLRKEQPDSPIVADLRRELFETLLEAKRYAEIDESMDILQEVDSLISASMYFINNQSSASNAQDVAFEKRYLLHKIGMYYQVLVGVKKTQLARSVAAKALEIDSSSETYNDLAWNGYLTGVPLMDNLEQARKAAEMTKYENIAILDTLIRVLHALNENTEACQLLHKAMVIVDTQFDKQILEDCAADLNCT